MLTLANPLGLLALLGIPAVLAIHFLQRKAVELPVSTLFLLERTRRDAASGRRIERLIPSVPLWMQLLAVLLLAWFLAEPRYQKAGSVQRVAIVLDSSASMNVFKQQAIERIAAELPALRGIASSLEVTVLESAPGRPRLFAGSSIDELLGTLAQWEPRDGLTDPSQALRLARSLVSIGGTVIYLTDTPVDNLPYDSLLLAVGEPIENVGFTGVSFAEEEGASVWRALIRNYGRQPAERAWSLESSAGSTEPRTLRLEPGALVTLQAAFPDGAQQVRVTLTNDRFALDDVVPLVKPSPKTLTLFTATSPAFEELAAKLLRSLESTIPTADAAGADLAITSYDPLDPVLPPGNSIIFVEDSTRAGAYLKGGIVAEAHPLLDGLNWQSLLVRETIELDRQPTDRVLLWQDKRPLIFLRESNGVFQLCFNFDLRLSNADGQPAFIVMLHRFAEAVREAKVAPAVMNLETGQPIRIATTPGDPLDVTATDSRGIPLSHESSASAPHDPGFLTIHQGDTRLLDAAVHFADTREADFAACANSGGIATHAEATLTRNTRPDPLWRVWILLLIAALLVSWRFAKSKQSGEPTSPAPAIH